MGDKAPAAEGQHMRSVVIDAVASAIPAVMVFLAVLAIPLSAAPGLALSNEQLSSWIFVLYAGPGLLGLLLAFRYRQPLVLTGNVFAIILFASESGRLTFSELAGAALVAGLVVAVVGVLGVSDRIARLIPAPIVLALVAGGVLPFVVRAFANVDQDPFVVGGTIVGYLFARRFISRVTPLLPALIVGVAVAAVVQELGPLPALVLPTFTVTEPSLTIEAVATITPVLIVILLLQANVPSTVFLRSQGYDPPSRTIDLISGVGTASLSLLGPNAVSIPLPIMPLIAGPECGSTNRRFRAAVAAGVALVAIGVFAGVAVGLVRFLPMSLIQTLAGLALFGVLASSLKQVLAGPLVVGPLFAFAIVQSGLTLFGLGPFLWALVIGLVATYLLEREQLAAPQRKRE
jgi:benzoate membrane transport protein